MRSASSRFSRSFEFRRFLIAPLTPRASLLSHRFWRSFKHQEFLQWILKNKVLDDHQDLEILEVVNQSNDWNRKTKLVDYIENPKKLSVFWAQKFRTRREISVFAKPCKISKRSLKEAKSRRFGGCEFRELIYSNFSIENYWKFSEKMELQSIPITWRILWILWVPRFQDIKKILGLCHMLYRNLFLDNP